MTPYEMMLSESQERMLIILEDGKEVEAKKIFDKWDLDFVVIGKTTNSNKLTLKFNNKIEGEIPNIKHPEFAALTTSSMIKDFPAIAPDLK